MERIRENPNLTQGSGSPSLSPTSILESFFLVKYFLEYKIVIPCIYCSSFGRINTSIWTGTLPYFGTTPRRGVSVLIVYRSYKIVFDSASAHQVILVKLNWGHTSQAVSSRCWCESTRFRVGFKESKHCTTLFPIWIWKWTNFMSCRAYSSLEKSFSHFFRA